MKKTKLMTAAALALAGVALLQSPASAQDVSTSPGDLILSFYVTNGSSTGYGSTYEVDLGNVSTYTAPNTTLNNITPLSADLQALYGGANYNSSGETLSYSIEGTVDAVAGSGRGSSGTPAINYLTVNDAASNIQPMSSSGVTNVNENIDALRGALGNQTQSSNNPKATTAITTATTNGFVYAETNNGQGGGAFGGLGDNVLEPVSSSPSTIELYSFSGTSAATAVGAFTLTNSGQLDYTNAVAVPEPSAYALGICAVVLFLVLRRRQTVA